MPPFSGKKKKEQLKAKRARKRAQHEDEQARASAHEQRQQRHEHDDSSSNSSSSDNEQQQQQHAAARDKDAMLVYGADRAGVRSAFRRETRDEVAARQQSNYAPLRHRVFMTAAGIPFGQWLLMHGAVQSATAPASESFPFALHLPLRGWHVRDDGDGSADSIVVEDARDDSDSDSRDEAMTTSAAAAARVERVEQRRFARYIAALDDDNATWRRALARASTSSSTLPLTSYERNLDVWRQLWRGVEACDVCVLVADARYPPVHVHLGLLHYITHTQRRPCVVLLNKRDLVPPDVLARWCAFLSRYLTRLGFDVVSDGDNDDDNMTGTRDDDDDDDNSTRGCASATRRACVVLRSFTANPRPETTTGGDEAVDVTRRRRKGERRRGKLYAQLRSGKMHGAEAHSDDDADDADDGSDRDSDTNASDDRDDDDDAHKSATSSTRYAASTNFKGMAKAERALRHDTHTHRELRAVAAAITELLTLCRQLGSRRRRRRLGHHHHHNNNNNNDSNNVDDDGDVHIAFVGFPNVGKSSLLNCISATKVVSVSATPGHTKHVQTMRVAQDGVTLIDTPGLALPLCGLPRPLQAVIGTHQIAQTRDPQSGVAYLAAHLPLEKLYGLQRPAGAVDDDDDDYANNNNNNNDNNNNNNNSRGGGGVVHWCAYDFCEAYAQKRGFYVKHGKGALDVHRAAIALLQEAYEGRLVLYFAPPPLQLLDDDNDNDDTSFVRRVQPCLLLPVIDDDDDAATTKTKRT